MATHEGGTGKPVSSVTLTVQDGYAAPLWYSRAAPSEVGRALTIGAAILDGDVPPPFAAQIDVASSVAAVREESLSTGGNSRAHKVHAERSD